MSRAAVWVAAAAALILAAVLAALGVGEADGALTNWQALALGLVQGLTELLPISSSGHLILVPWLADWEYLKAHDEFNQTFDVALHLGTLVAVAAYFRREIASLVAAWLGSVGRRRIENPDERVAWFVFIATIPAAVLGAVGEHFIAETLGEPWQIAILLALFALVLYVADRRRETRRIEDLGLGTAFGVGVAQSLALMPGVSRSGVTISAARLLGLDRDSAARFSFLLLVPITFGAVVYKGLTDVVLGDLPPGSAGPFAVGTLAAAVSGLAAISALLGYVRRHDYTVFVVYRLAAAAAVLLLIATGFREAGF
ncbi:MAG: undecaprenyl-diphosphate phosphatase [Actinomycetota bacterium]|nr:undecaprenyl-diphosphate phosphatase [Actinomycetota bacterium]